MAENSVQSLSVHPNPASNVLFIDGAEGETISVYDVMGRLVMREIYHGRLDIGSLNSGIYAVATDKCMLKFLKK